MLYDKSIINFVHSTILQKPQLISYEHLHAGYVSSINKAQTVTTDRLRRKRLTGEMKTDRRTDSRPPPPKFPCRSDEKDDDRGTSTFNTYRERCLALRVRLFRVHLVTTNYIQAYLLKTVYSTLLAGVLCDF
jgi:hypothetical protein